MREAPDTGGVLALRLPGRGEFVFIGESAAFARVQRLIEKLSTCDAHVLIKGETGTGKELAARSIHYSGARREAPFLPLNCGAIPENLVESELFGHVRGAFTDAREAYSGIVAQAEGGTLFLDEIEALGPRGQVALLRFLQDLEYRPVGGSTPRSANVRVIAASNVDLSMLAQTAPIGRICCFASMCWCSRCRHCEAGVTMWSCSPRRSWSASANATERNRYVCIRRASTGCAATLGRVTCANWKTSCTGRCC